MAGKQREEALRRATFADVEKRFQEELERVREIAALSQEQIGALVAEGEKQHQALKKLTPEQWEQRTWTAEELELGRRYSLALRLGGALPRLLARMLTSLPPEQWTALRQEQQLIFSTEPRPGQFPLASALARALRQSPPTLFSPGRKVSPNNPEAQERARQHDREQQERWAAATGYVVHVRLEEREFQASGALRLWSAAYPNASGAPRNPFSASSIAASAEVKVEPLDWSRFARSYYTFERRAALEQDPVVGVKKVIKPDARLQSVPHGTGSVRVGRLRDLLPDLARIFGVQFIGDAYWEEPVRTLMPFLGGEPAALYQVLDWSPGSNRWEHEGNVVRIRARMWFFRRPKEIPLRMVRRWQALHEQHGALPLGEWEQAATTLSDAQIDSLNRFQQDMGLAESGLTALPYARHALRLSAALTPAQRQALASGKALPVAQMTPRQRALFAAGLKEAHPSAPAVLDPRDLDAGSFSVTVQPVELPSRPGRTLARGNAEHGLPPPAPASEKPRRVLRVEFRFNAEGETRRTSTVLVAAE